MAGLAVRVLLIDNQQRHLSRIESRLQAAGFRTFLAVKCSEVLAQARLTHFDVAVIAEPLSSPEDQSLLEVIRRINSAYYLPILCLERHLDSQRLLAALELGADVVLDQDVTLPVLSAYLLALARHKRQDDRLLKDMDQLKTTIEFQQQQLKTLRENNAELRQLSITDPLTRIFNARYLQQWMPHALAAAKRHDRPLTLILVDIDHFKWINDRFGHPAGDYALKELAVLLKNCVRDSDVVARYGGDEFILALSETDVQQARKLADRIFHQLANTDLLPVSTHPPARITCSMGAVTFPHDDDSACYEELLTRADLALYAAKRHGRNCLRTWQELPPELQKSSEQLDLAAQAAAAAGT